MAYPSIISQTGSAARNLEPVLDALTPLIETPPPARRVLELASFPYEHIRGYAERWPDVEFIGTVRDANEVAGTNTVNLPPNVAPPAQLDIERSTDWDVLVATTSAPYDGVVMLNLVHCTPEGAPEHVFRQLSTRTIGLEHLLAPGGWVAAYGPFLNDDGTYRSATDEEFDHSYIKARHPDLGLRTPASISRMAGKWGFREELRRDMPKGNLWIVWRAEQ